MVPSLVTKLTLDQEQTLHHLQLKKNNLFITGGAGTGKSFVLSRYLQSKPKKTAVLASTGVAAVLLGGRTFHSFFGLGRMDGGPDATFQKAVQNKSLRKRLVLVDEIVIDEISMLSFDTLDCAEKIARTLRQVDEPWGGIRVIAVGDFAQLPPVGERTQKEWAFLGEAWASSQFKTLVLRETMRSDDEMFLHVLSDVRLGHCSQRVKDFLESHVDLYPDLDRTFLFPRRSQTEKFNLQRLAELDGELRRFETIYSGDSRYFDMMKRDFPIPEVLELKKDALVMVRVNDSRQRFVNGSLGKVRKIDDAFIRVEINGRDFDIEPMGYSVMDGDGNEVAMAKNFPINLAYASTIHKTQGATIDRLHLDLAGLWEPGHAYVALSRARRGADISIARWHPNSIKADPMVEAFYSGERPRYISPYDQL